MSVTVSLPHPGVEVWQNRNGITVLRLHYEADEVKGRGVKTFVPELNKSLSPWALNEYRQMTNRAMYNQEYEIDFQARLGTLMYQLDEKATVEPSFPPPADWTRTTVLDPHPRTVHFWLWGATDPWGDRWIYRELWPSKVGFRYEGGILVGEEGNVPEDDHRWTTRDYVETVKYLESAEHNPHLGGQKEKIFKRLIDYAARGFKGDNDAEDKRSIQERYEDWSKDQEIDHPLEFSDAVKDIDTGIDAVNNWLEPRDVELSSGRWGKKSRLHIMDCCPELIHELKTNRFEAQTSQLAEKLDPQAKVIKKRNHGTDCLRYYCIDKTEYVKPEVKTVERSDWRPMFSGVGA